jgi:hypothetical protein
MGAFLISTGSQHPDLANEFAKFMSGQKYEAQYPVRPSLMNIYDTLEIQTIEQVLEVAIPPADMRFSACLYGVPTFMRLGKHNVETALEKVQREALKGLDVAEQKRNTDFVVEQTQEQPPVLPTGKLALKVGMVHQRPLPHEEHWDQVIQEFTSADGSQKGVVVRGSRAKIQAL